MAVTEVDRCGTLTGMREHSRRGEKSCDRCLKAHAAWQQEYRKQRYLQRGPMMIDSTGTRRRIQALAYMGWTYGDIGRRMDPPVSDRAIGNILAGNGRHAGLVHRRTARQVGRIYAELHLTEGPSAITRRRARAAGFPSSMEWDNIDNPREIAWSQTIDAHIQHLIDTELYDEALQQYRKARRSKHRSQTRPSRAKLDARAQQRRESRRQARLQEAA